LKFHRALIGPGAAIRRDNAVKLYDRYSREG
jgi:hypothetical protein